MNAPDFSGDTERVALAKVMRVADHRGDTYLLTWEDWANQSEKDRYLRMADAAISHLGSGYRLPEANDENTRRLKEAHFARHGHSHDHVTAKRYLEALTVAFADPAEKPEPVFAGMPAPEPERCSDGCVCERCGWPLAASVSEGCVPGNCSQRPLPPMPASEPQCTATNGDYRCELPVGHGGEHIAGRLGWEEEQVPVQPAKDPVREGERRRRRHNLAEAILIQMASCRQHYSGRDAVKNALAWADAFIEAEDTDNAKAMEAYRCKK